MRRVRELALWGFTLGLTLACGTAPVGRKGARVPKVAPRDTRIVHEECAVQGAGAVAEDVNRDGRPDRTSVAEDARAGCRALDFNFDGRVDAWVYLDAAGVVRRRENDYDRDGRIDEVSVYQKGVLVEQRRATTLAGKLDTWQFYASGKVARTERDSNGDDYVDQWWEYPAARAADCPLIHSDVDGDGYPDPGATVDVCRDQYKPAPRDGEAESEPEDGIRDVPTELESAPAGEVPSGGSDGSAPEAAAPPPTAPGAQP